MDVEFEYTCSTTLKLALCNSRLLSFLLLCLQLCVCAHVCLCAGTHCELWMTSSKPYNTQRRGLGNVRSELHHGDRWCLPASFTYNNIQVHSPLPCTHIQTLHGTLNSISVRAPLCTTVRARFFAGRRKGNLPKKHVIFIQYGGQGVLKAWSRMVQLFYCWKHLGTPRFDFFLPLCS